jgi:glycine dehydrogenase subunit 1
MNFIPNTEQDRKDMMELLGISSIDELFADIDDTMKIKEPLDLPAPLSELEIVNHIGAMGGANSHVSDYSSFLGAGAYNHFIPSAVDYLVSRGEFLSSYTPYQAEASQGLLQTIFEFQSMICELTGMDVANASMYDGASALAEAALLAAKYKEADCIAVSKAVHPEYREVLSTYARAYGVRITDIEIQEGVTSPELVKELENPACVIVQSPNFFGCIEDLRTMADITHERKGIFITEVVEPVSLGLLTPPGELGADIVVGEAQAFGNALSYGGPHVGFVAACEKFLKKMPGRISGLTVDVEGTEGFILTLQAREQHVRRERATSNICTNQSANALAATIYLVLMGKNGLSKVAEICAQRAHYAQKHIAEIPGFEACFSAPFFNEFAIQCPQIPGKINDALLSRKIMGGLDLGNRYPDLEDSMLLCVTEMNTKEEIDALVDALSEASK